MAVTLEITMSLDGFIAGPDPSLEDPLGRAAMALHKWAFARCKRGARPTAWRAARSTPTREVVERVARADGATIMGRKMFSGGARPWEADPNANGWWGDEPPFHHPVFVLTHHPRETLACSVARRSTSSTDGVESALAQAAGRGGRQGRRRRRRRQRRAQQYLAAGLLDEMQIHVAPILLGDGTRLLDGLGERPESRSWRRSPRPPSRTCATASSATAPAARQRSETVVRAGLLASRGRPSRRPDRRAR